MRDELLPELEAWHEEDEFEEIVDAIMEIPAEDRDYELTSHLGRALNNLERYEEAVEHFLSVAEEGQEDPLWHYRVGFAYYHLDQYEEALRAFETADQLEPGDEEIQEFLELSRSKLSEQSVEEATQSVAGAESESMIDFPDFWEDSDLAIEQYVMVPPTDELIDSVEEELVFRLPAFYIQMMKAHNGGIPRSNSFPILEPDSGSKEQIIISGILGIGRDKRRSLCGEAGSRFRIESGGYPEIGVVICDCPSDSEVVMLDYREFGNDGEPEVVHVDKENNYQITRLAPSFEAFIRGLVKE
ncbi:SMI1/KNR4 family protein [Paenibacillus sp. P96]|uniref:SMI1/KNR4 family protein n=1 Tax=Paenibacillus zeirhizosphaerae TaxID=2987519 RepID=A0ABT9FNQ9_9BACL|nr:SMI1/KNR4 family protein [Paenibacillus sp. P96]MDP4096363.1 SMI1/KNR4 family protein [Paenibacillus sp. P96]